MAKTATLALNEPGKCVSKWAACGAGIRSHFMALIHFNAALPERTGVGGTSGSHLGGEQWFMEANIKRWMVGTCVRVRGGGLEQVITSAKNQLIYIF